MELLVVNLSGKAIRRKLQGREYLVANMVMIVPGVLPGSEGPLYYPPEEVARDVENWNFKPITLNHPGNGHSAANPEVLNASQLGFVLNSRIESGKLVADGWFDLQKVAQISKPLLSSLLQGNKVELSTGLRVSKSIQNGTHNGTSYVGIARNYKPDHLAILLDAKGACSIDDGCGVLVNQKGEEIEIENELSHGQVERLLRQALRSEFTQDQPSPFIFAVFDSFFVYEADMKLFRRSYTLSDSKVLLGRDTTEVIKDVEFKPVTNLKEPTMAKKELIDSLISNCSCWEESQREILNGMPDEQVQKFIDAAKTSKENEAVANAAKEGFEDKDATLTFNSETQKWERKEKKAEPKKEETPTKNEEGTVTKDAVINVMKGMTEAEWFDAAPPGVQAVVKNAKETEDSERTHLIGVIENASSDEDKESNKAIANEMATPALRAWAKSISPKHDNDNPFRSSPVYAGAAVANSQPQPETVKSEHTPLGLPSWTG